MKGKNKFTKAALDLRQRAEALLKGQPIKTEDLSNEAIQELLHELQVYQIELNMQNEELRGAQEQLEHSRDRYTDLFDFAPNGYFIFDAHDIVLEANLTGCQLLGIPRNQLIGKPFSKFVSKESQDIYFLSQQKTLKSTKSHIYELEIERTDKSTFKAQLESIAVKDANGNFTQLRTSVTDVTEVALAHDILESEQRLRQLVAAAAEGILLVDENGEIHMCNPKCEELFGYGEMELLNKKIEVLIPKSLQSVHSQHREAYIDKPSTRPMGEGRDLFGVKKSGEQIPIEVSLSSFLIQGQRMVTAFVNDITKRKQSEEALKKEKETAQLYLDLANAIFVVVNMEEEVVLINKKGCEVLGYPENQIRGKNWFDNFIPKEQTKKTKEAFRELVQGKSKTVEFFENEIIAKNGTTCIIEWHNAALTDANGEIIGTISSGVDITEWKKAQAALFNAVHDGQEQERERISRELHDSLGQQLAAIKMLFGAVEPDLGKLGKESHQYYQKATHLLEQAVNEARRISHDLAPHFLDANGLVLAIEKLCRDIGDNSILKCVTHSSKMETRPDRQVEVGIYRIVQELLSNIIKHAHATKVDIFLKQLKNHIVLTVKDNGIGFQGSLEELQQNGIGLRNISSRVKGLQGKLTLGTSKKKGTCVIIEVPLV
jgi:PAS domain S-box-containing protein